MDQQITMNIERGLTDSELDEVTAGGLLGEYAEALGRVAKGTASVSFGALGALLFG